LAQPLLVDDILEGTIAMENPFTLLIADRNRHVREFLRREFVSEGYIVHLAKDDRELLMMIEAEENPDLLILDLEMPYADGPEVLEQLLDRRPLLPVVIHTLMTDNANHEAVRRAAAFLEKRGNNIDNLKEVVVSVLRKSYPDRFDSEPGISETIVDQKSLGDAGL
jgi:CheY-like chemotaxis protein